MFSYAPIFQLDPDPRSLLHGYYKVLTNYFWAPIFHNFFNFLQRFLNHYIHGHVFSHPIPPYHPVMFDQWQTSLDLSRPLSLGIAREVYNWSGFLGIFIL